MHNCNNLVCRSVPTTFGNPCHLPCNMHGDHALQLANEEDDLDSGRATFVIFVTDGDGIRTEAFDPTKVIDPSLIIYNPVRVLGDSTIVTNGNQTDTIYDHIVSGGSFETALATRTFAAPGAFAETLPCALTEATLGVRLW